MKILVTGAGGFIGSHLASYLLKKDHDVVGTVFKKKINLGQVETIACDLTDIKSVNQLVERSKPEIVFHLAGETLIMPSWNNPEKTIFTNLISTLNLINEIIKLKKPAVLVIFGSSSEYFSDQNKSISEESVLFPSSPYALSKIGQDLMSRMYAKREKIKTLVIRPFSIIGPGKIGDVCSDFARRIVAIERGQDSIISVGDTTIVRDFLDIDDAVSGVWKIAKKGKSPEAYNLCSGQPTSVKNILDIYQELTPEKLTIRKKQYLFRPVDEPYKVGNNRKLKNLGWSQQITLKNSLKKIINYWRKQ